MGNENTYLLNVDKPLVVPVDTKIRFLITGGDVIHSWWVPALGWKLDAIPGIVNAAWTNIKKPGTYRGQCAELCGQDHGFMPIVVKASPKADFAKWLGQQEAAAAPPAPAAPAAASSAATPKTAQVADATCRRIRVDSRRIRCDKPPSFIQVRGPRPCPTQPPMISTMITTARRRISSIAGACPPTTRTSARCT